MSEQLNAERVAAETRKFIAEYEKLVAEREKLFQEKLKLERWRLVPLAVLGSWLLAAIIGAVVAKLF